MRRRIIRKLPTFLPGVGGCWMVVDKDGGWDR